MARKDAKRVTFAVEDTHLEQGWGANPIGVQRWHHPTWLLAREQLHKWSRSVKFKGMLHRTRVQRLPIAANKSPSDAETDGDLPLMLGGEGWPRSPRGTAQPFLAGLRGAKDEMAPTRRKSPGSRAWFDCIIKVVTCQGLRSHR